VPTPVSWSRVKITRGETPLVGLDPYEQVVAPVQTDEGIHGIGEAYSRGPDEATAATVADFETWLVGKGLRDVETLKHRPCPVNTDGSLGL
jgi:L-alanine-DL-glutamate epimerase-like enolase superfamily enzyme